MKFQYIYLIPIIRFIFFVTELTFRTFNIIKEKAFRLASLAVKILNYETEKKCDNKRFH